MTVRAARPGDVRAILRFIRGLARYEKAESEVVATIDDLSEALFGENARTRCLIAEDDGQAVGFALFFYTFSTWTGRYGIHLEDLFVEETHRGSGVGFALMERLAQIAVQEGCARFEWNVLDWNTPSIDFYEALGAEPLSEWIGYRLSGHALERLAAPADEG